MKALHMAAFAVLVLGGINWGLIGLFDVNLVSLLFGEVNLLSQAIYILVGVCAVYIGATHRSDCKVCSQKTSKSK